MGDFKPRTSPSLGTNNWTEPEPTDSAIPLVNKSDTTPSSDIGTTTKQNKSYTTLKPYTVPQSGRGGRPNRGNARSVTYQTLKPASVFLNDAQAQ